MKHVIVALIALCAAGCGYNYKLEVRAESELRWKVLAPRGSTTAEINGVSNQTIDIGDDAPVCVTLIRPSPVPGIIKGRIIARRWFFVPDFVGDWYGVPYDPNGATSTSICKD